MTPVELMESEVIPDAPMQRPAMERPGRIETTSDAHTVFRTFTCVLRVELEPFMGKPRVLQYDPEEWPFDQEPECLKDWNEAEE